MINVGALPRPPRITWRLVWVGLGLAFFLFFLLSMLVTDRAIYLAAIVGVVIALVLAVRHPAAAAGAFIAFTPVNRFVIMMVYHYSHSVGLTKGVELWKEGLLGAILVRLAYDLLFSPKREHRLMWMDLVVVFFIALGFLYLPWPGTLDTNLFQRAQGLRADETFMVAYLVGRGLHLDRSRLRWLVLAIIPGTLAVSAVAIFQFVAPSSANDLFNKLGYSDFMSFQGVNSLGESIAVRPRDLSGADNLPRASSLLLSDLALAFYQVLMVSLAAGMFYLARRFKELVTSGAFLGLMVLTLGMTLSRSAIGSTAGALALTAIITRKVPRMVVLTLVGAALAAVILVTGFIKISAIQALLSFNDASTLQHLRLLAQSVAGIEKAPLGQGLGTAGNIGQQQLGGFSITNESWYLQIGTEMGVLAMVVYMAVVALAGIFGLVRYFQVRDYWLRVIAMTVVGTAAAMLVLGNFLHSWENTPLSAVFWLFTGIAVRSRSLEASETFDAAR